MSTATEEKKEKKAVKPQVSGRKFVETWMKVYLSGGSVSQVARELEMTAANVSSRAKRMRSKKVHLPKLTRQFRATDVSYLNSLIDQLRGDQQQVERDDEEFEQEEASTDGGETNEGTTVSPATKEQLRSELDKAKMEIDAKLAALAK